MQLSALQIVLLVLVAAEINVDRRGLSLTHARPVIVGFLCGLILGDMNSGLYIGGTFTLMSLGVAALGGSMDGIIDISAYMDDTDLPTQIKELFDSFDPEDEVVMMTDMLGGSVNQQFCPYVNDHRHLICGINLPCALSLVLQPQDMPLTAETIRTIVEESRSHLIYVNEYNDGSNEDDE